MKLYQDGGKLIANNMVCDYCGKIITDDDENSSLEIEYKIIECNNTNPMFNTIDGIDRARVNLYELFKNHSAFVYCRYWTNKLHNCEKLMLLESAHYYSLYELMYESRIRMLRRMFDLGIYSPEDFNLTYDK